MLVCSSPLSCTVYMGMLQNPYKPVAISRTQCFHMVATCCPLEAVPTEPYHCKPSPTDSSPLPPTPPALAVLEDQVHIVW